MWYYSANGQQQGPVEEAVIREQYAKALLSASTMVWKEGLPQWISIRDAFPDVEPRMTGEEHVLSWMAPVYTSWLAIIAGYLGLFCILIIPAPLAVIFGWLAIRDLKKHPGQAGWGRAIFGLIAGLLVCLGILFFILCMMIGAPS